MSKLPDVVVVGSGPNGLAAAITVARAGRSVLVVEASSTPGGGARTAELTEPGVLHDVCSAVHPFALASPFFASLDLGRHGLEWLQPEIPLTHPLDGGRVATLRRSVTETAEGLGPDAGVYRRLMEPLAASFGDVADGILGPVLSVPEHPLALARIGIPGALPPTVLGKLFKTEEAKALLAGAAAHSFLPLNRPLVSALGLALNAAGHAVGWPIPRGGSGQITEALVAELEELGGEIECDRMVRHLTELPSAQAIIFDTDPVQMADIAGDRLPGRYRSRLRRYTPAPGVFKLDLLLDGPIPWADEHSGRAGTVHVGGTMDQIHQAESDVVAGKHSNTPFTLVAQPSLSDPSRDPVGRHVVWSYCHVPNGSTRDMTSIIEAQIERFAPGFRNRILARASMNTAQEEAYNPNHRGGDIAGGSLGGTQLIFRPLPTLKPYRTPNPTLFLGSASAPPGAGVHGMCGHLAARSALASALR